MFMTYMCVVPGEMACLPVSVLSAPRAGRFGYFANNFTTSQIPINSTSWSCLVSDHNLEYSCMLWNPCLAKDKVLLKILGTYSAARWNNRQGEGVFRYP